MSDTAPGGAERRAQTKAARTRDKAALRYCDAEAEPAPPRGPEVHHERPEPRDRRPRHWKQPFWKRRSHERARRAQAWRDGPEDTEGSQD